MLKHVERNGMRVTVVEQHVTHVDTSKDIFFVCNALVRVTQGDDHVETWAVGSCPYHSTQWDLSEEFAPDAAATRAIGRALRILFPQVFAHSHMGNEDEVAATFEKTMDALMGASTIKEVKAIASKLSSLSEVLTEEQRQRAREMYKEVMKKIVKA